MTSSYQHHLKLLQQSANLPVLRGIQHGIEREGLRVTPMARLAQTPHPETLGKALTHPYITTDFSEAMLEFITPVQRSIGDTLHFLEELHIYNRQNLKDEYVWSGSMPAIIDDDDSIPIAQFGSSNIGRMKSIYREGLTHRYGKPMQAIAGIHYNFSLPTAFWSYLSELKGANPSDRQSSGYFALIRNFRRYSWLLMYLFGASPAVSKSFFKDSQHSELLEFDQDTLYAPYATSLRMSDLGYSNDAQSSLNICYSTLDDYISSISDAIKTPYPTYEQIGVKKEGRYLQLNTNLLQIENEYYSTIRPKRVARSGEKPVTALKNHGVEYIEVRCLDINPFEPLGLGSSDAHFVDVFLLYSALQSQENIGAKECSEVTMNFNRVVKEGRRPGLVLQHHGEDISLKQWGSELVEHMRPVAQMLDQTNETKQFTQSLEHQQQKLDNTALTPSAQVMEAMKEREHSYVELLLSLSKEHSAYFSQKTLKRERSSYFNQVTERSIQDQLQREQNDNKDLDAFLAEYFVSE